MLPFRAPLCAASLLAALLAAAPALALEDLTGTWLGTAVCDALVAPDQSNHSKNAATLVIDDDPSGIAYARFGDLEFRVVVLPDPGAPAKGRVGGPSCDITLAEGGTFLQLSVKTKDGSEKGTMQGDLVATRVGFVHAVQVCRLKLKRTSTTIETPMPACAP